MIFRAIYIKKNLPDNVHLLQYSADPEWLGGWAASVHREAMFSRTTEETPGLR